MKEKDYEEKRKRNFGLEYGRCESCGSMDNLYKGYRLCKDCYEEMFEGDEKMNKKEKESKNFEKELEDHEEEYRELRRKWREEEEEKVSTSLDEQSEAKKFEEEVKLEKVEPEKPEELKKERLKEITGSVEKNIRNRRSIKASATVRLTVDGDPDKARAKLVVELDKTLRALNEAFASEKLVDEKEVK